MSVKKNIEGANNKKPKRDLPNAISVKRLLDMKFKMMPFEGKWKESFGVPECTGVWMIWANSSNGKTRFAVQLGKYLTNFDRVIYNTLEEGARSSFQRVIREENIYEVRKRFQILNREPIEILKKRLAKKKSPNIIFIDSFQYANLSKKEYIELKEQFKNKLFIFVSHAEGKQPMGRVASFVRYDCDLKIRVEGFRALNMGRAGGGVPYIIWEKGSNDYWGDLK